MDVPSNIPTLEKFWQDLPPLPTIYRNLFFLTHSKVEAECCGYIPRWNREPRAPNSFSCNNCHHNQAAMAVLDKGMRDNHIVKNKLYIGCMLTLHPELLKYSYTVLANIAHVKRNTSLNRFFRSVPEHREYWLILIGYLERARKQIIANRAHGL